jgi:uncharacterized protein
MTSLSVSNGKLTGGIRLAFANSATAEPEEGCDHNGFVILSRRECLHRLTEQRLGRVAVSMRALPVILPVRFALLDEDIVFRTAAGARLSTCCDHAVVAFESDAYDPHTGHGWSVCITGMASPLTEPHDIVRASDLGLPQIGGDKEANASRFVRVRGDVITGRETSIQYPYNAP